MKLRASDSNSRLIGDPIIVTQGEMRRPKLKNNPSFINEQHILACHLSSTQESRRLALSASLQHAENLDNMLDEAIEMQKNPFNVEDSLMKESTIEAGLNSAMTQSKISPRSLMFKSMECSKFDSNRAAALSQSRPQTQAFARRFDTSKSI